MSDGMIDVNVTLGQWPCRRLAEDAPGMLAAVLRENGVTEAWCGSFEALLHKDIAGVNARLAASCAEHPGLLVPFGTVNPMLPDWQEDLWRCAKVHAMPGIRLYPNYHAYTLDTPEFRALLERAAGLRLLVQIAAQLEDKRMMHPLLRVAPVDFTPLPELLRNTPGARVILLNALKGMPGAVLQACVEAGNAYLDTAMLDSLGIVRKVLEALPGGRLLFGSHAPLFYHAAATLKLDESALTPEERAAITRENVRAMLGSMKRHAL